MSAPEQRSLSRQLRDSPGLLVRGGWGSLLLLRPDIALRALAGTDKTSQRARVVIRVLGARHLIELAIELRQGPAWRRLGAVVDVLHSVTALGFSLLDHRWRRAALADAAVAGGFAAVGLVTNGPRR